VNNAWNTLPYLDTTTQSRVKLQDSLLGADVNLGVGLLPNWEVGISLPAVISQTVHDQGDIHGQFTQSGSTEVRLNTKYRVYGSDENGLALVGTVNFNRVTDDPYSGSGAKPTYNLDLAGDHTFGKFIVGANLGRRFRTPGSPIVGSPIEPLRGQWTGSIAASRLLSSLNTKIGSKRHSQPNLCGITGRRKTRPLDAACAPCWPRNRSRARSVLTRLARLCWSQLCVWSTLGA
jgi:hypothetical protein